MESALQILVANLVLLTLIFTLSMTSASASPSQNVILNANAETLTEAHPFPANSPGDCQDDVAPAMWDRENCMTSLMYGASKGHLSIKYGESLAKYGGGINFFYGGCIPEWWNAYGQGSSISQVSPVPVWAKKKAPTTKVTLRGHLGGKVGNEDTMIVTAEFLETAESKAPLSTLKIGPLGNKARSGKTKMVFLSSPSRKLPRNTKFYRIRVQCINYSAATKGCCDGYADNLDLHFE